MAGREPEFTWSDAWLLHAVAVAGGTGSGASLTDIIGSGDGINHALFTAEELRRGFGKLTAAGYVAERGALFFLEGPAIDTWRHASEHRSLIKQREVLERFLDAAPYPAGHPGFEDPAWPYPSLTDARIHAAEREYQERHKHHGRTRRRDPAR